MSSSEGRKRLAAILAADVVGYSRLMTANERRTVASLDVARAIFRSEIEGRLGRVVDGGDSVLAVFESAAEAVNAALAVQRRCPDRPTTLAMRRSYRDGRRVVFVCGIHRTIVRRLEAEEWTRTAIGVDDGGIAVLAVVYDVDANSFGPIYSRDVFGATGSSALV